jgi:hypothetical protein
MNNEHVIAVAENFANLSAMLIAYGVSHEIADRKAVDIIYSSDNDWHDGNAIPKDTHNDIGPFLGRDITGAVHFAVHGDVWPASWATLAQFM